MMKPIAAAKDLARSRDANHGFEKKHACRQRPLVATKRGIVKRGPAEGERVLERYRAVDEGHIEQELTHVPASGERVVVRRTFMRAA